MTYRPRTQPDAGERAAELAGRDYSGRVARRYVGTATRPRDVEEEPQMKRLAVHHSSKTPEWPTPTALFDALDLEFRFTLDPCATHENAKCALYFTAKEDGLSQEWRGRVFMNPPYGRVIGHWMKKAHESAQSGATVVCLVPARTDTAWWHDYAMPHEIRLLRGRIQFVGAKHGAPFPSAIVVMRPPAHCITAARQTTESKPL